MHSIGVRELKEHTGEILRRVREQGEELEITYHGRAIARLIPIRSTPAPANLTPVWADLDRLAVEIGARWPAGVTATEAVSEGRRELCAS